ncbi:MAG: thermonuclease family protein [Planctomycetes bacterium]|nr:thermonuclease family protein [Planctomycetota bacterium]
MPASPYPLVTCAFALLALAGNSRAAETYQVVSVPDADHVVVLYRGLPVNVALAHLEAPADAAGRTACQQRLTRMVNGKKVEVLYTPNFGTDASGGARVQLVLDKTNVNEELVATGLARYQAAAKSEPLFENRIKAAQDKAKKDRSGVWGASAPADAPAPVAAVVIAPAKPAAPVAEAPRPTGPFCSELDNTYYFATGSPAVASVNPQRLVFYADEAAAKRAGKQPSPAVVDIPSDGTEGSADKIFADGKDIYAQAIAAGNTSNRDVLYEKAFVVLSKAMQVYSPLVEKRPDDERLAEKLRECMQLRYGSVKQRRFQH